MPFGDRTGPMGLGPMTGRAAGLCAGNPVPGYMNPVGGRGFWSGGRPWRSPFYAAGSPYLPYGGVSPYGLPFASGITNKREADMLKGQVEYLQNTLEQINKRLVELEQAGKEKKK